MSITQSANIAALVSPIVQEALFTASETSIMRGLVKNYTVPMNSGKTAQVPVYPTVSAVSVTEGADLTANAVSVVTTTKSIDLGEVGIMTTLTDFAKNTSEQNVVAHLGRLFGEAIARKIDQDLIALFSGFSGESGPGANTEITISNLFDAAAELRTSNAPGPYYGVFHPKAIFNVKSQLTNTFMGSSAANLPDLGNEALRGGFVGQIAGIQIFESSNITVDGSGDSVGAVFAPDALGIAMMDDLKIEVQRDASVRADEVVATATYGVSELFDSYGRKMTSDSTI